MANYVFSALVVILLSLLVGRAVYVVYKLCRRWFFKPKTPPVAGARCRCGYEMDQLDTIRCPECGRVSGFDATPEELNLTDEQLRRVKAKRDERRRTTEADA